MYIFNFFNILRKEEVNHNYRQKTFFFVFSYFFAFIIVMLAVVIMSPVDLFITNVLDFESVKGLIHQTSKLIDDSSAYYVIIFAPLFEETLFRLILRINRLNFSVFIFVLTFKLSGGQLTGFEIHTQFLHVLLALIIFALVYFNLPNHILGILNKNNNKLIIISILCFGLIHIFNIKMLHWQLTLLYPFFVLPQIIIGYFITNLRIKYGFFWGVLFHSLVNLVPFLLAKNL